MSADLDPTLLDSFETDFQQLEEALTDPYVSEALKLAKEYNELMRELPVSDQEAIEILNILNAHWAAIQSVELTVSGSVSFPEPDGEIGTHQYDEVRMISEGFYISGDPEKFGTPSGSAN